MQRWKANDDHLNDHQITTWIENVQETSNWTASAESKAYLIFANRATPQDSGSKKNSPNESFYRCFLQKQISEQTGVIRIILKLIMMKWVTSSCIEADYEDH